MSSRAPQLRQTYVLTGAVVALVVVAGFALLASRRVTTIVERQANERGKDVARHAASLVSLYMRERHREAERCKAPQVRTPLGLAALRDHHRLLPHDPQCPSRIPGRATHALGSTVHEVTRQRADHGERSHDSQA